MRRKIALGKLCELCVQVLLIFSRPVEIDSDNSIEFEDALIGDDDDIFGDPTPQQRIRSLSKFE